MATIDDIRNYFEDILQRSGSEVTDAEINSYVSAVDSGALTLAQARAALINSPEGENVQDVVRLYQTFFGRVPDQQGLNDQVDTLRNGPGNIENLANGFAASQEFTDRFGGNTVNTAFINAVYQQVLGRTPSAGEVQFYLDSGFSAGRIALAFSESPEFVGNTEAAVEQFLDAAGQQTAVYTGPLGGNVNVGETFTLTTDIATVNGTAANDTFNGVISTDGSTLQTGDVVNGGAGNDTLNILVASTPLAAPIVELNSVETVSVRALASTTLDATDWDGVTTIVNDRSTSQVNVEGVQNNATLVISSSASDLNVEFVEGALGVDGTVSLSARGALSGAEFEVTAGGSDTIKAVNLDVVTASTVGVDLSDTAEVLNISGAGKLTLSGFDATTLETVDASKNSGGVDLDLTGATALETVTGSAGNDTINFTGTGDVTVSAGAGDDRLIFGGTLDANDKVDGGAGNDTIVVNGGDYSSSANVAGLNAITTIEIVEFSGAATTITGATFKNTAVTELLFNTAGLDTVNNAGARLYSFGGANTGDATFNSTLGQTTLNIALKGDAAAAGDAADVGVLTANGATTINIASSGGTTANNTISALTVATNSSIVITGAQDLDINGVSAASSIDGSAATGDLKITGSTGSDIIVGGAGDDVLFGGPAGGSAATREVFVATFAGNEAGGDTTIAFDGVTVTLDSAPATGAAIAAEFAADYNLDGARTYNAVNNSDGTVTFTARNTGTQADVNSGSFVVTPTTADDTPITVGVSITTQGAAAGTPTLAADTLTGGAGNDTFVFTAGSGTVVSGAIANISTITDLNLGSEVVGGRVDTIDLSFSVTSVANSGAATAITGTSLTAAVNTLFASGGALDASGTAGLVTYGGDTYLVVSGGSDTTSFGADDVIVRVSGVQGTLDTTDFV